MSLLADLTPLCENEPLDKGDLCWCHSPAYARSHPADTYRADWCYVSGQARPHGRRVLPYPNHAKGVYARGRYSG